MGDNVRAGMDEVEQIDALNDEVRKYGQIEDDETAQRAISLRARIMELKGIIDKKREEQKRPHLKAAREVDEIWMPPVKKATAGGQCSLRPGVGVGDAEAPAHPRGRGDHGEASPRSRGAGRPTTAEPVSGHA